MTTVPQIALERARALEAEASPSADHNDLMGLFERTVKSLPDDDPLKEWLQFEQGLYLYQIAAHRPQDGFIPFFVFEDRVAPPPVEAFHEKAVPFFESRLTEAEHPTTRARLADFLWVRLKRIHFAENAIHEYIRAVEAMFCRTRGANVKCDYFARATYLTLTLKRPEPPILDALRRLATHLVDSNDAQFPSLVTSTADLIDKDPKLSQWMIDQALLLAERWSELGKRHLFEALTKLAIVRRAPSLSREFRVKIARSFEAEAALREGAGGMIVRSFLQDAIRAYQDLGMTGDVERLTPSIQEVSRQAREKLQGISTEVSIPTTELRNRVEAYLALRTEENPFAHLQCFALYDGLWPPWLEIETHNADLDKAAPLRALFQTVKLTEDGRTHERSTDPDKRREHDEIEAYTEQVRLLLAFSLKEVALLRDCQAWSEELLVQALQSGAFFDANALKAIAPGIRAFEHERYWEAVHVLVPQIERVVRTIAKAVGAKTLTYRRDTEEYFWTSLKTLLTDDRVIATLEKIAPDFPRELGYLLIDTRGLNIRDDLAHGILSPEIDSMSVSLLCIMILLCMSTLRVRDMKSEDADSATTKDEGTREATHPSADT